MSTSLLPPKIYEHKHMLRNIADKSNSDAQEKRLRKYVNRIKENLIKVAKKGKYEYDFKFPFYVYLFSSQEEVNKDYFWIYREVEMLGYSSSIVKNRRFQWIYEGIRFTWI